MHKALICRVIIIYKEYGGDNMNQKESYNKLFELIEKNDIAMMTTIQDSKLVSRPMSYQDVDTSGDIWFMSTRTEKLKRLRKIIVSIYHLLTKDTCQFQGMPLS